MVGSEKIVLWCSLAGFGRFNVSSLVVRRDFSQVGPRKRPIHCSRGVFWWVLSTIRPVRLWIQVKDGFLSSDMKKKPWNYHEATHRAHNIYGMYGIACMACSTLMHFDVWKFGVDPRFSAGVVLYKMLFQRFPFKVLSSGVGVESLQWHLVTERVYRPCAIV